MMKNICVIDDDQIYQIIIKKIIFKAGNFEKVYCYENGCTALSDFKDPGVPLPHLILLDINMPQMDGWEFLTNLKESRPNLLRETTIYMVTSSIALSDRNNALALPEISGFISKPITVEKLREIGEKL